MTQEHLESIRKEITKELEELKKIGTEVPAKAFDKVNELDEDELASMKISEAADMCMLHAIL